MNRDKSLLAKPTRVRYGVLGFACALAMITYLDRACFGVAQGYLKDALGLDNISDLMPALAAFNIAYAVFEVPTGWLGDVFGPRRTLIRIVLWWSFFTVLTGLAGLAVAGITFVNLLVLVLIRFLFGIGEAGAYPNITRALHNWFPIKERGIAQGAIWFCSRFMGGLTPLIWMVLVERTGLPWRAAFALFGVLGVGWCVAFALWFRNRPEEHPAVNEAERKLILAEAGHETEAAHAGVPWGRLLTSPTLWALCLMYFCMSYGWYFNLNYLPAYLEEQHGVAKDSWLGSLYKGGPLIFGAAGCLLGGWLTDQYIRRTGSRLWGRRVFGIVGHCVCVPCYLYCIIAPDALTFALSLSLAGFSNDLAMGSAWAACQDIGKRYAGIVAGCMNTVGNLGGFVATVVTGWIIGLSLDHYLAVQNVDKGELKASYERAKAKLDEAHKEGRELPEDERTALAADVHRWKDVLKAGNLPGYNINFVIYGVIYGIAVLLWFGINATRPVVPEAAGGGPADEGLTP
jgi:ACS family glucarate transporter-like MFS transporter